MSARRPDEMGRIHTCDLPLFPFLARSLLPATIRLHKFSFRRPRECEQKGAVLGCLHIMRHALVQSEQVSRREIHHSLGQLESDMAVERVH
jgi:hypothetical protein